MKKNLAIILLTSTMLCCLSLFAACDTGVHTHTIEKVEAVAATCETAGNIEYYHCTDCKKTFSDEIATTEIAPESVVVAALGHDEESHEKKAATCTEDGWDAYVTCKREGCDYTTKVVIPAAHTPADAVKENVVNATCKAAGSYDSVIYCSVCENELSRVPKTIDKLAHTEAIDQAKAATCTEKGLTEGKHCSVCEEVIVAQQDVPALNHDYGSEITTQPTCTEKGVRTYTCKRTGCGHSYTEDVNALNHDIQNHDGKPATCTEDGYEAYETCKRTGCEYTTYKKVDALKHNTDGMVEHKDATCTEAGVEGGTYCTRCNNGKTAAEAPIDALGHNTDGSIAHKDATCTEAGVKGGTYCTRCNDGKAAAEATVDAIGHKNKVHHTKVDAKCTEAGTIEYWACPDCGKDYSDENCTKVVTELTIDALDHDMKPVAKKDATCTETGYNAYEQCSRCDHNTKGADLPALKHDYGSEVTTQPTCTEKGVRTYTCKRTGCGHSYTEDVAINPNAHDIENHVAKAATCTEDGYEAYETCKRAGCEYTTYQKIDAIGHANKSHHVKVDAKCTETGTIEYWECPDCKKNYSDEACTKVVTDLTIKALDHDFNGTETVVTPATCVAKGSKTVKCTRCDETTTKDVAIDSNAHDIENHVAKAATCTEDGYDAYVTCKRTGCEYTTYQKIDALGHDNKGTIEHKDATCTETGVEGGTYCSRCNNGKTSAEKTIDALGHDEETHVAKAATCTEDGYEAYVTCKRTGCEYTTYQKIDKLGHANKQYVAEKDATFDTEGNVAHWHCSDCGVNFSDEACTTVIADVVIKAKGEKLQIVSNENASYTVEAESLDLSTWEGTEVKDDSSASGNKYVSLPNTMNNYSSEHSHNVGFFIRSAVEAKIKISIFFSYTNPNQDPITALDSIINIYWNGVKVKTDYNFKLTDGSVWELATVKGELDLIVGNNIITFETREYWTPDVDCFNIVVAPDVDAVKLEIFNRATGVYTVEAENLDLSTWPGAKLENNDTTVGGLSGEGNFSGTPQLGFTVKSEVAGKVKISLRVAMGSTNETANFDEMLKLTWNGETLQTGFAFDENSGWTNWETVIVTTVLDLNKGFNTFVIQSNFKYGVPNLDCIIFEVIPQA